MKWQASKYSWAERKRRRRRLMYDKWHSNFALFPRTIPEQKHESIVVPRHWIWLERYEYRLTKNHYDDVKLERRPYTGAPTLRQDARHGE